MSTTTQTLTADQLLKKPSDGFRYELVKGELRKMSPGGSRHGAVIIRLSLPLAQQVESSHLGVVFGAETGFILAHNPDTVLAPDIAFVRKERIPAGPLPDAYWDGAPDLAVEVLSPGDTVYEVEEKVEAWLKAGARAVWVVNSRKRTVRVHRPGAEARTLAENEFLDAEEVVPGFRIKVSDIFV